MRTKDYRPYVLALDPGKTSGVVLVQTDPVLLIEAWELDELDTGDKLCELMDRYGHDLSLVCEDFIITVATAKNSDAPWSLRLIGVMRREAKRHLLPMPQLQTSSNAKTFTTNPRLKAVDLWHRGGGGHANDALRHVVLYLVNHGWQDRRLLDV